MNKLMDELFATVQYDKVEGDWRSMPETEPPEDDEDSADIAALPRATLKKSLTVDFNPNHDPKDGEFTAGKQADMFESDFASKRSRLSEKRRVSSRSTETETYHKGNVNSAGKQIAGTKQSLEHFYKWFGDSVTVDEDEAPLLLYHGTDKDFSAFETNRPSINANSFGASWETRRKAIFLADNSKFSEDYATLRDGAANVMPVYAKIENPLDFKNGITAAQEKELEEHGFNTRLLYMSGTLTWELFDDETGDSLTQAMLKAGYDGAIIEEDDDNGRTQTVYVVLNPKQIKSAIGNKGSYNDTDVITDAELGTDEWNEAQHPRGQPENKGEFAKSAGGSTQPAKVSTRSKVLFEVAPDPHDEELTTRWNKIDEHSRAVISSEVLDDILPDVLKTLGGDNPLKVEKHVQYGGYLDNTNPSLSLLLDKSVTDTQADMLTRVLGSALTQDSMARVSKRPFKGSSEMGAVVIRVPADIGYKAVETMYNKLRKSVVDADGNPLVNGHTTDAGSMVILVDKGTEEVIHNQVLAGLGNEYEVGYDTLNVSWPEKGADDYGFTGEDKSGKGMSYAPVREWVNSVRTKASEARLKRIEQHEASRQ